MISILIPVYNTDVTELVRDVYKQCELLDIAFEVVLVDDASELEIRNLNRALSNIKYISYEELPANKGRSKIRNYLVNKARFDTLVFLDSDSQIMYNPSFIETYLKHMESEIIVNGGRIYPNQITTDNTRLHHQYGSKKECPSLAKRNAFPIRYFHSNNFMVKKTLIIDNPFPDMDTGYGYEDLAFATAVTKAGIEIKHIVNPVEHMGLISADQFLENIRSANTNLLSFYYSGAITDTPLIKTYERLKTTGLIEPVNYVLNKLNRQLESNLRSNNPSLLCLDFYKLNDFINQSMHQ